MQRQFLPSLPKSGILFLMLLGLFNSLVITGLSGWSSALLLTVILLAVIASTLLEDSMTLRMMVFFSLLAVSDFVKRCTFLIPDQSIWSQYLVLLAPPVYYLFFILRPWLMSQSFSSLGGVQKLVLAYVALALANTWISPAYTVEAKAAATVLMILPWTMLAVAVTYRSTLLEVANILTLWGLVSAGYGFWQFCFGPTPVELMWADAVGTLSIGASHLANTLRGPAGPLGFWRINGLQPDAITFGIFMMTAMAGCLVLRSSERMTRVRSFLASGILGVAIILSPTRTIWIGLIGFLVLAVVARRCPFLLNAKLLFLSVVGMFFTVEIVGGFLYRNYFGLYAAWHNPFLMRAFTLGTIEARLGALDVLTRILPERWLLGVGYGASPWITGKFGGAILSRDFTIHNFIVELIWFVGLPGLILFSLLLYLILVAAQKAYAQASNSSRGTISIICGYLIGMILIGFGNGGVFFGYYFFFFAGILVGGSPDTEGRAKG